MNKEGFTNARASIDYVYNLKNQLEKKISSRKIWNNSDKKELSAIRRESLRTLTALLEFCDIESSDLENAQASIVTDVRNKLSNILNEKNINSFSYSTFNLIGPALIDLFNYISAKQSSTSDQSKSRSVTFPVVALNKTENGFNSNKPIDTPIDRNIQVDKDIHLSDTSASKTKEIDYFRKLVVDRDYLLDNLDILKDITGLNYIGVFEKHKEKILSPKKREKIERILHKRASAYKIHLANGGESYWMGEAMIYLQQLLRNKENKKINNEPHKNEGTKAKNEQQELLRNQSAHFPKIISLLEKFKKDFENKYFSKSPQEIKEAFAEQYTALVLDPITKINPKLLSLSDLESRVLQRTHRKIELYERIPFTITSRSDGLIKKGVAQGFIFGEIDSLIEFMEEPYKENKIS